MSSSYVVYRQGVVQTAADEFGAVGVEKKSGDLGFISGKVEQELSLAVKVVDIDGFIIASRDERSIVHEINNGRDCCSV